MGILLVYDITDETSFNNIRNWMRNIEQHASDHVNKVWLTCVGTSVVCVHVHGCLPTSGSSYTNHTIDWVQHASLTTMLEPTSFLKYFI